MRIAVTALIILPAACSEICSHSYGENSYLCNYGRDMSYGLQDEQLMGLVMNIVFLIVLLFLATLLKNCTIRAELDGFVPGSRATVPSELI